LVQPARLSLGLGLGLLSELGLPGGKVCGALVGAVCLSARLKASEVTDGPRF